MQHKTTSIEGGKNTFIQKYLTSIHISRNNVVQLQNKVNIFYIKIEIFFGMTL